MFGINWIDTILEITGLIWWSAAALFALVIYFSYKVK